MEPNEHDETLEHRLHELQARLNGVEQSIRSAFLGQEEAVELLLACLIADGHALIEGAPGLGKTTLVRALSDSMALSYRRIQFTPDLMPGDILGTRILEKTPEGDHAFRFERGPVFANVLLADEINRATPRTQSAMLEAMQERQVTTFGETLRLDEPFLVIATQNPIEMEGTYPLPEAQVDRFLCKIELDAPSEDELFAILRSGDAGSSGAARSELARAELLELRGHCRRIEASDNVLRAIVGVVARTDPAHPEAPEIVRQNLRYGASPRGAQAVLALGRARALLHARPWLGEDDLEVVLAPALRHRLVFSYEGEASGVSADEIVAAVWQRVRGSLES